MMVCAVRCCRDVNANRHKWATTSCCSAHRNKVFYNKTSTFWSKFISLSHYLNAVVVAVFFVRWLTLPYSHTVYVRPRSMPKTSKRTLNSVRRGKERRRKNQNKYIFTYNFPLDLHNRMLFEPKWVRTGRAFVIKFVAFQALDFVPEFSLPILLLLFCPH